eukprot:5814510-Prymnesium_polylepis.1
MVADERFLGIPSYSSFGVGQVHAFRRVWCGVRASAHSRCVRAQLEDTHDRFYRVAPFGQYADPPWRLQPGALALHVKVRKRTNAQRDTLLRDAETRAMVVFPRAGETLELKHTKPLLTFTKSVQRTVSARVVRVSPRDVHANTGLVLCQVV